MIGLVNTLHAAGLQEGAFEVGSLVITYPGYKRRGDYRLTENGIAPTHASIVHVFYELTNETNFNIMVDFLEDIYQNGLHATTDIFPQAFKEKIFWLTLQEDINYPQPRYAGRRLPFQRFYEAMLAKLGLISLETVIARTNNHGGGKPRLFDIGNIRRPIFYAL